MTVTPVTGTVGTPLPTATTGPTTGLGALTDQAGATAAASGSAAGTQQLGQDTFLKLMVAQLRNQDPMNPTDSSEFLAQTAQFTSLEKLETVASQSAQSLAAQLAFGASGLVGRSVSYLGEDGETQTSGTVGSVRFTPAGPVLTVDGTDVPIAAVVSVEA